MSLNGKMPLQASFLITNNKTLKDLKTEIVLTFALQLFDEYQLIKEDNGEIKNTITVKNPKNNDITIDKAIDEISLYLRENVIQKERLFKIFREANLNKPNFLLAKQYEPYGVYYEKLGVLLKNYIPNGGLFMPEYLGLLLIYNCKYLSYTRFPFIENYNFENLLAIYSEVNINIKKNLAEKHPNTRLWEHRTVFDEMEKIAQKITKEYDLFQYKVNVNRVSKTRKKK